jgi:hypothetical protein
VYLGIDDLHDFSVLKNGSRKSSNGNTAAAAFCSRAAMMACMRKRCLSEFEGAAGAR